MMKFLFFHIFLKPLIKRNYRSRMRGRPDEWYWADSLAVKWGYFVLERLEAQERATERRYRIEWQEFQTKLAWKIYHTPNRFKEFIDDNRGNRR